MARAAISSREPPVALGRLWNDSKVTPLPPKRQVAAALPEVPRAETEKIKDRQGLECLSTYLIPFEFKHGDLPVKANERSENTFDAAIAEFVDSPNATGWVGGVEFLQAQITFFDTGEKFCHRVSDCYWLDEEEPLIKHLKPGGRARLLICIKVGDQLFASERITQSQQFFELVNDTYFVQVYLSQGGGKTFKFKLNCKPIWHFEAEGLRKNLPVQNSASRDEDSNLEVARQLTKFMEEGQTLLLSGKGSQSWEAEVKTFIAGVFGELESLEWSKPYPTIAYPRLAANRDQVDRTFTLLQRLGDLATRHSKA